MLSQSQIKLIRALSQRKYRQMYHKFIAEGEKLVREAINWRPDAIEALYVTEDFRQAEWLHHLSTPVFIATVRQMEQISQLTTPPGVVAIMNMKCFVDPVVPEHGWKVFLDGISDPGNVGTIIRTAAWFGISTVFLGPGTADFFNSKVVQASMGAIFSIPIKQMTYESLDANKEMQPIHAATMDGILFDEIEWPKSGVLALGSESQGLSANTISIASQKVKIPPDQNGNGESLNVAVAGGILLHHISRIQSDGLK